MPQITATKFTSPGLPLKHPFGGHLRTIRLLSDHETTMFDCVAIGDFVKHILGVKSECMDAILSKQMKWQLNPQLLANYRAELGAQRCFKQAFDTLVVDLAQRVCPIFNEQPDKPRLDHYLRSVMCCSMTPEVMAIPPPPEGAQRKIKKGYSLMPITVADLQLVSAAIEFMRNPGIHYSVMILVDVHSVTLRYYDHLCIIRTVSFDIERDAHIFALFAYGISHGNSSFHAPRFVGLVGPTGIPFMAPHIDFPPSQSAARPLSFYVVNKIHYESHTLIGRGTIVAQVVSTDPSLRRPGPAEVLKSSWKRIGPDVIAEAEIIKRILQAIPAWDNHLPAVKSSATYTATQLNLPAASLLHLLPSPTGYADKELHVMVMPRYEHLWKVKDVLEFQEAFVDCVECHYHAYSEARILHRDLSDNNLMFKRSYQFANGHWQVQGILNDWDLASILLAEGHLSEADTKRRTGSVPFMSVDLLDERVPPHVYRHDLESFFYILIWAAVHFDFNSHTRRPVDGLLAPWSSTYKTSKKAKLAFLCDDSVASSIFSKVGDDFAGVLETWIKPLRTLFQQGLQWDDRIWTEGYDIHTAGGMLSFEKFMATLGRTPHELGKG